MKFWTSFFFLGLLFLLFPLSIHSQTLTFIVGNEVGLPGDTVDVQIITNDFINVSGYQGTMNWDSSKLDFLNWSNVTPGLNHFFGNPGQGIIPLNKATFSWVDFTGGSQSFMNGTVAIQISFIIKANATPGVTPVTMDGSLTPLGYTLGSGLLPPNVTQGSVTINTCTPTANAAFTYPASVCQSEMNPVATITGDPGGFFSVNNGATINPNTGELDLTTTMGGTTYTVTYSVGTPCPDIANQSIQVLGPDDASFSIADTVCINASNPIPNISGLAGGQFSVDNGASINMGTGELDMTTVSVGVTYEITYTTNGPCPDSSAQMVYIEDLDDASFTYIDSVCIGGLNPLATVTGQAGGTFSVDQGATIDAQTGELFLNTTTTGTTYNITYLTQGQCPNSSTQTIAVVDSGDASFAYPSLVCPGGINPQANISGSPGGIFSVSPAATINPNTGELDLTSATAGTLYTITYILNDICQSFSEQFIFVGDTLAPDSVSLPDLFGSCDVTVPVPSTLDNCAGTISGTTNDTLFYDAQGSYVVTWTFDDGNGNQLVATQNVLVQDTIKPVLVCQDITIQLDPAGIATITPADLDGGTLDNCTLGGLTISQDSFSTADLGANNVTLIATDIHGNVDSCISVVTVEAYPAPVVVCVDDTIYVDSLGIAILDPRDLDGGSTVTIGMASFSASRDTFDCGDLGANDVTLFVQDSLGVTDSCVSVVMVMDTLAPLPVARDVTVFLDSMGDASITVMDVENGSFDNCGIESQVLDRNTFACEDLGVNTLTYILSDSSGNTSEVNLLANVRDTIAPVVLCRDILVVLDSMDMGTITVGDVDAGTSDACGVETLSLSQETFGIQDTGEVEVLLTAVDSSGNSSSCTAIVTVERGPTSIRNPLVSEGIRLQTYPNPVQDVLHISFESRWQSGVEVSLVDALGKSVYVTSRFKSDDQLRLDLDMSTLAKGIYILGIAQEGRIFYSKIVRD